MKGSFHTTFLVFFTSQLLQLFTQFFLFSSAHFSYFSVSMALIKVSSFLIITTIISSLLCSSLHATVNFTGYPAIFNFGDSNSDTGGIVAGKGFPLGSPNGQTYFLKPAGRFCDGRLIIDFLTLEIRFRHGGIVVGKGLLLGSPNGQTYFLKPAGWFCNGRLIIDFLMNVSMLPLLNPYLDSVGAPNFQRGCNFATGGATILPATAASGSPFSFGVQVSQFRHFKARVLDLLTHDKKLENLLPSNESFSQGLYMFDIGQNDLDGKFYSKSENEVVALIPTFISELETGIKRLYDQGARKFWIHNTGPLGCLPRIIAVFGKNPSSLDEFGCVGSHNRAAKIFNSQLNTLRKNFQRNFTDAYVTYIDVFSIKLKLISNFSLFGFEHSTTACCGYGGLPLNYDSRIQCGETKTLNGSLVAAKPCNNTAEYVNWDGNHYTEAANLYISSQILTGEYLDPRPENISLPYYMSKL